MADWKKIKTEYITTDTSYRKLAEKYGVHKDTIAKRAKDEAWADNRRQHTDKTQTKIINAVSDKQVDRAANLMEVSDQLLTKVKNLVEQHQELLITPQNLKHISGVLKDIKEIQMIRSDADMREQEARIANLRKQAEAENTNAEPVRVIIEDDLKKYSQ